METDAVVGQVLEALQTARRGRPHPGHLHQRQRLRPYIGVDELDGQGPSSQRPAPRLQADIWEGGHRVPFIVRWPGVVKPGRVSDQLICLTDLMATCAAILGAKLPDNAGEDSVSLLPLLKGRGQAPARQRGELLDERRARLRQGPWKLILASGSGGWSKGGDATQPVQLYNLADDIGETHNLAAAQPDRVAGMSLLETIITAGRSTPAPRRRTTSGSGISDGRCTGRCRPRGPSRWTRLAARLIRRRG